MTLLEGLNPAQRRAVEAVSGPLLVLAGPGSGKTRVITHRVAYLVRTCGVRPHNIMAVTFTNKAANEMRERLERLVPGQVGGLTLGTFHAICARMLRRDGRAIGIDSNFVIYDESDQQAVIKRVLKDQNLDEKKYSPKALLSHISAAKAELRGPLEYSEHASSYLEEVVSRVYRRYQELLSENRALDFDDLLMTVVRLFRERPDVLDKYQTQYVHILVDEFQDTNRAQYAIVKQLAAKHRNICVVGDEDQSIYSWRQADIRNILDFEYDFPDARVILLEQNYRSTKTILSAAQSVIAGNSLRKEKNLWTDRPQGTPITVYEAYDEQEEAAYVLTQIERMVAKGEYRPRDFAVMYRVNAQSRVLEDAFRRSGMPYRLVGTKFYDRKEIKDVLAYLRVIYNPYDLASLMRIINVPPRGLGARTVEELERWARKLGVPVYTALQYLKSGQAGADATGVGPPEAAQVPSSPFQSRAEQALIDFLTVIEGFSQASAELDLVDLIELVLKRSGYADLVKDGSEEGEERWANIKELQTVASDYVNLQPKIGLATFLEEIALVSDVDEYDDNADAATLITLHAAKGLEFPVVFIVGMEEGLCPHVRSFDDNKRMEEERRLCYVGMTRAKDRLFLTYAFKRRMAGSSTVSSPSRYLADISPRLISGQGQDRAQPARTKLLHLEPEATATNKPLDVVAPLEPSFKRGDRVRHAKFGEGIVVESNVSGADEEVVVLFAGAHGIKRLLSSFARLEKME
ncbi:MAG: ATP-dependent helicase [Chloroflexota bacterium]